MQTHTLAFEQPLTPHQLTANLLNQEWLLTNGSGAYAMGTVAAINARRYHGLLIACTQPPVGRVVVLNQMFEHMVFKGHENTPVETSTCAFKDAQGNLVCAPQGHQLLKQFEKGLGVSWTSRGALFELTRTVHLHWKTQAVTLAYTLTPKVDVTLALSPMVTMRDFHSMRHHQDDHQLASKVAADTLRLTSLVAGKPVNAVFQAPGSKAILNAPGQNWWYDIYYTHDNNRGQEDHEDYFNPARFEFTFQGGKTHTFTFTAALGDQPVAAINNDNARKAHLAPMLKALTAAGVNDESHQAIVQTLAIAADDFVVDRTIKDQKLSTILAGYPWFSDWGRDTFISLPGLLLSTGRLAEARNVLQAFAQSIHQGLVPNRFDDYNASDIHYNTVDASLWFIDAAMQYYKASNDQTSWDNWLAQACMDIIDAYLKGTRYDIQMAGDGLISAGNVDTQLTWMDAACNGTVFTPRHGKAVEINALWYNALAGMSELIATSHKPVADHYKKLTSRIGRSFMKVFWDENLGHLRDHVWTDADGHEHIDASLRPNQIFAGSLPHSPVPKTKRKLMLAKVREQLLTPVGLKTLPASDAHYHPYYQGPAFERDEAYHQGTIWPWLIGPFIQAELRAENFSPKAITQARQTLEPLLDFIAGPGVGQLYEIHEAALPHRPVGCPAQAWSVASVIATLSMIHTGQ